MSTAGGDAQDPSTHGGKVLRLNEDGSVPRDNPFVGRDGYRPEIFTLGHRTTLGLAVHPSTQQVWQSENARTAATRSIFSSRAATTVGRS
jgi:glucose/arabinose dehydrogenase